MRRMRRISSKMGKRGQEIMGLPFTMIFSIIIIAIVIFVGIYVIKIFIDRGEQAKIGLFSTQLGDEVTSMWQKQEASKTITLELNKKIQYVCFANLSAKVSDTKFSPNFNDLKDMYLGQKFNMFFWPTGVSEKYHMSSARNLLCGDKQCLYFEKNPTCIENVGGVAIKLVKLFDKPYVIISQG